MMNSEAYRAHLYNKMFKYSPKLQRMVARRIAKWYLKQDKMKELGMTQTDLLLLWQNMRPHSGLQGLE